MSARARREVEDRFWSLADWSGDESACWPWTGRVASNGYGQFSLTDRDGNRTTVPAHRMAYELERGLDLDAVLDHACHDPRSCRGGSRCPHRRCCNPWHLKAGTAADNVATSRAHNRERRKTHCPRGHEYDAENTYVRPGYGFRGCRACDRRKHRLRRMATAAHPVTPGGAR